MRRRFLGPTVLTALLLLVGLGACSEERAGDRPSTPGADEGREAAATDCATDLHDCATRSSLADHVPAAAERADGEPIVLGMINQENTPAGSFPELSSAVLAAASFVNEELGGVNGRPIEIEVCNTGFSPEGSTDCAQRFVQQDVPAVIGGIDVFGNGIDTLADNGIPFVGGIPVSDSAARASTSRQWSGGIWGATIAFADHAANELGAESAVIVHPEFGPIGDAAERGRSVLEQAGVGDITMVPYPILATDLSSPLQAAATGEPDALIMLAADTGCAGAFEGIDTVGFDAQIYMVGACATPAILEAAGIDRTDGVIVNVEGSIDRSAANVDFTLYAAVLDEYGDGVDPVGAGTVSFRSFMNLWTVLVELDEPDAASVDAALAAAVDRPSFMGHEWTCDGEQLRDLPAMCSPQQILAVIGDLDLEQIGTWIDVGSVPGA